MAKYGIYSKDGEFRCDVKSLEYVGKWMDECYVSARVESAYPIDFAVGDYINYRGVRYVLANTPSVEKNHTKLASSMSYVYDGMKFTSPSEDLMKCMFLDYVADDETLGQSKTIYSNSPTFEFFCEDATTLAERIQINLSRLYDNWEVVCVDGFESAHNIHIQADKISVWDAVQFFNTKFKTCYSIKQRYDSSKGKRINMLVIGETLVLNNDMLEHGKGKGLTRIDRSRDDSSKVVNRLRVYGSKKNIPTRFYNEKYDPWYKMPMGECEIYDRNVDFPFLRKMDWVHLKESSDKYWYNKSSFGVVFGEDPSKKIYRGRFIPSSHSTDNGDRGFISVIHGYSWFYGIPAEEINLFRKGHNSFYIISGLSMSEMWNEKDLWVNPRSIAPNEMSIPNLMLPSFLNYYGKKDGVTYELESTKTYETKDEDGNVVSLQKDGVDYEPIYLYDSKGGHLLDRYGKWMLKLNLDPYLEDATSVSKYGVREGCVYFDSEDDASETPEIYPTITGMTKDMAVEAGYALRLKADDNGNLDEVFIGTDDGDYKIEDDGVIDNDTSTENPKGEFFIEIKDIGFNLKDYWSDTNPVIRMTSGDCGGREFEFVGNNNNPIKIGTDNTSNGYSSYQLRLKRSLDEALGIYFPNKDYAIKPGDTFVLLNIDLPRLYVDVAAEKLRMAGAEYLTKHNSSNANIVPTLDHIKIARDYDANGVNSLYYRICEGGVLKIYDESLEIAIDEHNKYFIDSLNIKEESDKLPTIDVKLVKEKEYSTIEKLKNDIREVKNGGVAGITTIEATKIAEKVGNEKYVNKRDGDTIDGAITMNNTLNISKELKTGALTIADNYIHSDDFVNGFDGAGFELIRDNGNGISCLELDEITVRGAMRVFDMIVSKIRSIGGQFIISDANGKIKSVELINGFYKISFEQGNPFQVNDLIRCQVGSNNRNYWVEVKISDGEYIQIDEAEFANYSAVPIVGDDCVLMGNTQVANRQSFISIDSAFDGKPCIDIYRGVSSKTLSGRLSSRLGVLNGIADDELNPHGEGLYSDNAFLKGDFYLRNGKNVETQFSITEEGIKSTVSALQGTMDYSNTILYNPSFTEGEKGWQTNEDFDVMFADGSLLMSENTALYSQAIDNIHTHYDGTHNYLYIHKGWVRQFNKDFVNKPEINNIIPLMFSVQSKCLESGRLMVALTNCSELIGDCLIGVYHGNDIGVGGDFSFKVPHGWRTFHEITMAVWDGDLLMFDFKTERLYNINESFEYGCTSITNEEPSSYSDWGALSKRLYMGDLVVSDGYKAISFVNRWDGSGDFFMYFGGEGQFYSMKLHSEELEARYATLFEQSEDLIRLVAGIYGGDDEALLESGLVVKPETAGIYTQDEEGNVAAIGTYKDGVVKLTGNEIQLEGDITANGNVRIREDGGIEAKTGLFSGFITRGRVVINDDNFDSFVKDYSAVQNYGTYLLDFEKIGGFCDFQISNVLEGSNGVTIQLPTLGHNTPVTNILNLDPNWVRSFVGSTILAYNNSSQSIGFSGIGTNYAGGSVPVQAGQFIYLTCNIGVYEDSEQVFWTYIKGSHSGIK